MVITLRIVPSLPITIVVGSGSVAMYSLADLGVRVEQDDEVVQLPRVDEPRDEVLLFVLVIATTFTP